MPQDFEPSQSDQESLQSMSSSSQKVDAHRSLGDIRTLSEKKAGEEHGSIGDSPTFGEPSYPPDKIDDTQEVVELSIRYKVEKTLGQGGMGEVLLATDTRLDRKVAIKRILGDAAQSRTAVNRFLTEAKAIAALNHPNIVQIYDYGRDKDGPFLVMEYIDGQSLLERCRAGALPLNEAIEITCQLCDGLGRAHSQGIIHRDIKPANILLTKDGIPKLTDFGLAKSETADTGMTMTGAVLGTLDFMPPEQRLDATQVDARSDLWSLAATLYQMVTGKSPKIIKFKDVPASLEAALGKSLEDSKEERYQSASSFKDALRNSLRDHNTDMVVMEQGQCLKCGTKNDSSRRFCRNPKCGVSLEVSCLSCSMKIPVWEAVCGSCGGKQEELATAKKHQKDSERAKAEEALEAKNFALAHTLTSPLAEEQDPRLQQLVSWAKQFLVDIDNTKKQYLNQISQWLSESLQHEKAYDFASGIRTLLQVSESMREVKIASHTDTVAHVLSRLNRKQQEVWSLEKEIGSCVKERKFSNLLAEVEKLLQLVPGRADMLKLKEQLVARNAKLKILRDEVYAEAEKALTQQDYSGCLAFLGKIDESFEDPDILVMKSRASEILERVQDLDRRISHAIKLKQYDGLLDSVEKYLALRSQDRERQELREQLIARESKIKAQASDILAKAIELRSKAEFGAALSELGRIPLPLLSEEIVSFERKITHCYELQQLAMEELRHKLEQSDFESEPIRVADYLSVLAQAGEIRDFKFEQLHLQFQMQQDGFRHQLAQARIQKVILRILGFVTAGMILVVGMAVLYASYQRSRLISAALEQGDYAAVLEIDPGNVEALLLKEKADALASGNYRKVLLLDPADSQALAMKRSADIQAALATGDYDSALRLEPVNSQALEMRKSAMVKKALTDGDHESALRLDPANSQALTMKKSANIQSALAMGDYETALRLEPSNSRALAMKKNAEMLATAPIRNSIGMDLKLLPSGVFTMGEGPESHAVTLTTPFYIGVYEVTQEQYQLVTGQNPNMFDNKKPTIPVENISWEDAIEFCRKLSAMPEEREANRVYRLPTEAEWEYACRAGTTTLYSFGDDESLIGQYAWVNTNSGSTIHPVGQKKPNAWGLYDMHGNVWEWCSGKYTDFSAASNHGDPIESHLHVVRGGSSGNVADSCRSAFRYGVQPVGRSNKRGFRVAFTSAENSNN